MSDFTIPSPGDAPKKPSELTREEIADLSASKRNIILYEKTIEELKLQVLYFKDLHTREQEERRDALTRCTKYEEEVKNIPLLKRAKFEGFISLTFVGVLMAVGSGLISSFPNVSDENVPWQFACGWSFIWVSAEFSGLVPG